MNEEGEAIDPPVSHGFPPSLFLDEKDDEDLCGICLNVCNDPKQCRNNGHIFCDICIRHQVTNYSSKCPNCKEHLDEDSLSRNVEKKKKIDSRRVKCKYTVCDWTGKCSELMQHHGQCSYTRCKHCSQHITNANVTLTEHEDKCTEKTVKCHNCNQQMKLNDLELHQNSQCPRRHVSCPFHSSGNQCCDGSIPLDTFPNHLQEISSNPELLLRLVIVLLRNIRINSSDSTVEVGEVIDVQHMRSSHPNQSLESANQLFEAVNQLNREILLLQSQSTTSNHQLHDEILALENQLATSNNQQNGQISILKSQLRTLNNSFNQQNEEISALKNQLMAMSNQTSLVGDQTSLVEKNKATTSSNTQVYPWICICLLYNFLIIYMQYISGDQ